MNQDYSNFINFREIEESGIDEFEEYTDTDDDELEFDEEEY